MRLRALFLSAILLVSAVALAAQAGTGNEPARPLSARGLENLAAFTRLLGYVRYFHPSDQAAAADWEKLALAGVQKAEGAANPEELARVLEDFFRPVAPTVRVYSTAGARPDLPAGLAPPAGVADPEVAAWEHLGVEVSSTPSLYRSRRVGKVPAAPEGGSAVIQYIEAEPYRGKRVVMRAWSRADVQGAHKAALGLNTYRKDETRISEQKTEITSPEWRVYEVAANVDPEAERLMITVGLIAEGRSWWDDVTLEVEGGGGPAKTPLKNGGFEATSDTGRPSGWTFGGTAERSGYRAAVSEEAPKSGRRSLAFSWVPPDRSSFPKPGEIFVADLGGGVSAMVPLALYKDGKGTLPHAAPDVRPPSPEKPAGFAPSGDDRTTRLAGVALAWNVFQHFYPYFDVVRTDWPAELRRALSSAATDQDAWAFLDTLRRLVAALHDGHGSVYYPNNAVRLPLLWDWVEDQLVVTKVAEGAGELRRGDVILTLDGRPAREALAAAEELIAAATPQHRRYLGLGRIARCRQEKQVRLEARRATGETFTAAVPCSLSIESAPLREDRPEKIAEVRPGIFYVDLDRISDEDFKGAVDRLAAAKGVIFDLRGYPRNVSTIVIAHLTGETITSARWNVPLTYRPDRQGVTWPFSTWPVEPAEPRIRGKAAFLTDGRAISYAETYLGIIEHYKLAAIVGGPTAGTNGNINPFNLPGGYQLTWTGMRVLKHNGSLLHGVGIQPTVPASSTLKGVAEGRDELLEKAIEVVGGS